MRVNDDLQSSVERFYKETVDTKTNKSSRRYIFIRQRSQDYVFHPNGGTDLLRKILVDRSLKGRAINKSIDIINIGSSLVKIVPKMGESVFHLPQNRAPQLIVCKESKTIMIEPSSGYVIKIPDDQEAVTEWIQARKSLPSSVNAPRILTYNKDYPYLIEEFISGEYSKLKLKNWRRVIKALRNLRPIYQSGRKSIVVEKMINDFAQDQLSKSAVKILRRLDLPDKVYRSRIHGDLHPGNTIVDNGEFHILDWEQENHDYIIRDMFHWLLSISKYGNNKKLFAKMVKLDGEPGNIFCEMSQAVGDLAYGQNDVYSGLPLLYLISRYGSEMGDQNYNDSLLRETISILQ